MLYDHSRNVIVWIIPFLFNFCSWTKEHHFTGNFQFQADDYIICFFMVLPFHCYSFVCLLFPLVQFSPAAQMCLTLCDPMNCSTPGLPVHHKLPEFTQTHAHRVGDAIQPSHPLSSPPPPAPNPSQHQGLFQWVNSSNEVAKVLEFQLQHQSFQWTPRTDLL